MTNNTDDMYEKAGLSSLERLVGKSVSSICFVPNHVQILFDDLVFTCFTMPVISLSGLEVGVEGSAYKDKLCEFIGKSVQSITERPREGLSIYFDGGDYLGVSLRLEDATSVEAAMLQELKCQSGIIFDVWRYE